MASTRVLLVSDSHLSARTPEASANWDAVVEHVAAGGHDLVVHAGDVCADGPGRDDDLAVAQAALGRLDTRVRVVPGNHDVGDNPFPAASPDDPLYGGHDPLDSPVTPAALERFRHTLGPDHWALDLPGWRVVGLNSLLFGTGLDAEADQWDWLADVLPSPSPSPEPERRLALVLHKPLAAPPDRPDVAPGRYTPPVGRDRLLGMVAPGSLGVVVSGHVHQHAQHALDGVLHVWTPTTWAILPDRIQPVLGDKRCGAVELVLHDDGRLDAGLVEPAGLAQNVIIDTVADPYGLG